MPEQLDAKAIFMQALELSSEDEIRSYLDAACNEDELRREVESLLAAHGEAGGFLGGEASPTETRGIIPEKVGRTIGRYKLLQEIGEGGMGTVFMAEQTQPVSRRVALKIIKPGMDSKPVIARFEAERQALAMMDHPNIAKVLDAGTTDSGRPYFVMELVKGVPITEYCDDQKLPIRERLQLFMQVCQGVQHAHQKGIIHRDIKPSNVLVAQYDSQPVPKIIDFGVAKAVSQRLTEKTMFTQYGQIVGTLEYMSPEQAQFNQLDVDTRSDIYSLGVLLYELLTGETPFDGKRLRSSAFEEVLRILREEEPPKPSGRISTMGEKANGTSANRASDPGRLGAFLRGDLDWIVMKALEKDRARRYETANSLSRDISSYLAGAPVEARAPTFGYRAARFLGRNRIAVGVVALLFVSLSVGLIGTAWQWKVARRNENAANAELKGRERAEKELKALLANYVDALTDQALLQAMNGRVSEAKRIAEELDRVTQKLQRSPTSVANVSFIEGVALFFGGNEPEAHKKLQKAAEQYPDNFAIKSMAAWCEHYVAGDAAYERSMLELHGAAMSEDPHAKLFFGFAELYRDPINAAKIIDEVIMKAPSTIAFSMRSGIYGHLALHTGDYRFFEESWRDSSRALKEAPNNAWVLLVRLFACQNGMVIHAADDDRYMAFRSEAARIVQTMEEHYSSYQLGRLLRAGFFLQIDETDKAAATYLELADEGAWLESLAPCVFDTPHTAKAIQAFDQLKPKPPNSQSGVAYLIADKDLDQAIALCWAEFEDHQSQRSATRATNALLFMGELEEAKKLAKHALAVLPDFHRPYSTGLERLRYVESENLTQFANELEKIRMPGTQAQALHFQQGMLALAKRDIKRARKHFKISSTKEPFRDSAERLWAMRWLTKWKKDSMWTPPGPRRRTTSNE